MTSRSLADVVKAYDVRGTVPDQLDPEVAHALGVGFAEVVVRPDGHSGCVVARDMRDSGPSLVAAFADGLRSRGVAVTDIGLASTDGLYHASGVLELPGAMFTASHNPAGYNGIKLCRSNARPVGQDTGLVQIREVAERVLADDADVPAVAPGVLTERDTLADYGGYLRRLVDITGIRPLTVVIDAGNGMAGHTVPAVLGTAAGLPALPLTVIPQYFELDGTFPNHEANPLDPATLVDLQAAVREHGADLGLAFDGDADRCVVIDERGEPVSPSAVTALIARREVARAVADGADAAEVTVVHNAICSAQVPEVIAATGARAVRTRVGHSFVKAEMARHDAVFGGEHSAHYYFRDFWFADTGMLAALHVVAALGSAPEPLSVLMADLQRYPASGEVNSTVTDAAAATARVRQWGEAQGAVVDLLDGLTLTVPAPGGGVGWWLNLRASNTEPLLRLNVEAADSGTMERVRDEVLAIVRH
ncbi:MAG: phosphomannomutase/phosphoglucomutase [Dermatophilaceae bacterium]